jgi:hypothetical protein
MTLKGLGRMSSDNHSPGSSFAEVTTLAWTDARPWATASGVGAAVLAGIARLVAGQSVNDPLAEFSAFVIGPGVAAALLVFAWHVARTMLGRRRLQPECWYVASEHAWWLVVRPRRQTEGFHQIECVVKDQHGRMTIASFDQMLSNDGTLLIEYPNSFSNEEMKRKPWGRLVARWAVKPRGERRWHRCATRFRWEM